MATKPDKKKQDAKKKGQLKDEKAKRRQEAEDELFLGLMVEDIKTNVFSYPELPREIRGILENYCEMMQVEKSVFGEIRWFEDIFAIKNKKNREQKLGEVAVAVSDAIKRRSELGRYLGQWKPEDEDGKQARFKAAQMCTKLLEHIPEFFHRETDVFYRLDFLVAISKMTQEQKLEEFQYLKNPGKDFLEHEQKVILGAYTEGSARDAKFIDPFFDKAIRPLSKETMKEAYDAMAILSLRICKLRDIGGTMEDVEAALAHIPYPFWPDKVIDTLQAWRTTEREIMWERITTLKPNGNASWTAKINGALSDSSKMLKVIVGVLTAAKALPDGALDSATEEELVVANSILGQIKLVCDVSLPLTKSFNEHGDMKEAIRNLSPEDVASITSAMLNISVTCKGIVDNQSSSTAALTFVENVPIIATVASGIDLIKNLDALRKIRKENRLAKGDYEKIRNALQIGKEKDRALVYALKNERVTKLRQYRKQKVETLSVAFGTAGNAASISDPTGAAVTALKATSAMLSLGNKIVFSYVDWKHANLAMKTLELARAGSRFARVEVFQRADFYAKMYIAILAREGHPIALEFIVNRGLTEEDLNKPTSLRIVREALLKSSDQGVVNVHDHDMKESRMDKWKKKLKGSKNKGERPQGPNEGFRAPEKADRDLHVSLESWKHFLDKAKADCLKKDRVAEKAIKKSFEKVDRTFESSQQVESPEQARVHILTIKALDETAASLDNYAPMGEDEEPHEEMLKCVSVMKERINEDRAKFKDEMLEHGLIQNDWAFAEDVSSCTTERGWSDIWSTAATGSFPLLPSDEKVVAALQNFNSTSVPNILSESSGNPHLATKTDRRQLKEKIDAGEELLGVLLDFRSECVEFIPVLAFIDFVMDTLMHNLRKYNTRYLKQPWKKGPIVTDRDGKEPKMKKGVPELKKAINLSGGIKDSYEEYNTEAKKKGFIGKDGDKIAKALGKWESERKSGNVYSDKTKYKKAEDALVEVSKACEKVLAKNEGHFMMMLYVLAMRQAVFTEGQEMRRKNAPEKSFVSPYNEVEDVALSSSDWEACLHRAKEDKLVPSSTEEDRVAEALDKTRNAMERSRAALEELQVELTSYEPLALNGETHEEMQSYVDLLLVQAENQHSELLNLMTGSGMVTSTWTVPENVEEVRLAKVEWERMLVAAKQTSQLKMDKEAEKAVKAAFKELDWFLPESNRLSNKWRLQREHGAKRLHRRKTKERAVEVHQESIRALLALKAALQAYNPKKKSGGKDHAEMKNYRNLLCDRVTLKITQFRSDEYRSA